MSQITGPERLKRKQEQAEANGEKWENRRTLKIWRPLEAIGSPRRLLGTIGDQLRSHWDRWKLLGTIGDHWGSL